MPSEGSRPLLRGEAAAPQTPSVQAPISGSHPAYEAPGPVQGDDIDQHLFGPSGAPDSVMARPSTSGPPMQDVNHLLPLLMQAARDPNAPPQIRGLVQLLLYHSNQ